MQHVDFSLLESLRQTIEQLVQPLEAAQVAAQTDSKKVLQNGLELIMGELTMIALLFTQMDGETSESEVELINDMRRAIYGSGAPLLQSTDYWELCREFLRIYPNKRMTLDHLPSSIGWLDSYDQVHGTEYARTARALYIQFAEALVNADRREHPYESMSILNFKETLNSSHNNV